MELLRRRRIIKRVARIARRTKAPTEAPAMMPVFEDVLGLSEIGEGVDDVVLGVKVLVTRV